MPRSVSRSACGRRRWRSPRCQRRCQLCSRHIRQSPADQASRTARARDPGRPHLPSSSRSLLDSAGSQVDATRRQSRALADARDELLPLLLSGRSQSVTWKTGQAEADQDLRPQPRRRSIPQRWGKALSVRTGGWQVSIRLSLTSGSRTTGYLL